MQSLLQVLKTDTGHTAPKSGNEGTGKSLLGACGRCTACKGKQNIVVCSQGKSERSQGPQERVRAHGCHGYSEVTSGVSPRGQS